MKAAVLVFPGTNREKDMADALARVAGRRPDFVWHQETDLSGYDLVVVPGGFSYGDYLRCGAIAGTSPIMREVAGAAERGVPVLGVCNGFQILTETGLLPGALMRNAGLRFICKYAHLKAERCAPPFTQRLAPGRVIEVAVAHNEGNYFADPETLDRLEGEGRVAFRYCDAEGTVSAATNLNGSQRSIAGIVNARGNVLGMMPHPEDATDRAIGKTEGLPIFESLVESLAGAAA